MKLKIITPTEIIERDNVTKVIAESFNGNFCLLPRHIDYVTEILPGILTYEASGEETFLAVDEGILVKKGFDVTVSTRNAIVGSGLGSLRQAVREKFEMLEEKEREARAMLMKLEADFAKRYRELQ